MSAATVLFTDIVSFSEKPTADQRRLVESLTAEVVHELRPMLIPPLDTPSILALPTGDGLALAFLHRANQPWDRSTLLGLILRLHKWAAINSVSLRVGIHVGPVELVTDINGKPNVCGDTINYSQRVMDASSPRQTLFSEEAFRAYIGTESPVCTTDPFSNDLKAEFIGPIEVFAKHGLQIIVYKLALRPPQPYMTNDDPIAKHLMLVSLTPLPKEVVGSFSDQIHQASHIALVQLTGDRFLTSYKAGKIEFSDSLKRLWVFMPEPTMYTNLKLKHPQATVQLVNDCIKRWKEVLISLNTRFPTADLKLGLFSEPPYLGASFIDWERPGGKIHVSPYIWNVAAPDCPGYDMIWVGQKPSAIYETYVEGLRYLNKSTKNEVS